MKPKSLKSTAAFDAHARAMSFRIEDLGNGSTREVRVDFTTLLDNVESLLSAVYFAAKTRLRNATAGQAFDDAVEAVEEMASSISAGKWESRAREPGESRASPLIRAIASVLFAGDTRKAQDHYDSDIAQQARARGVDLDPDDEEGKSALRKLKADYKRDLMKVPAIKRELLRLEAEAQMEAARRKLEAAEAVQVPES